MKYVICESKKLREMKSDCRTKSIILFSNHLVHAEMVPRGMVAVSAGEMVFGKEGPITCAGGSSSLKLKSHPEKDQQLIWFWFTYGESMLTIASIQYDEV